MLVISVCRRLGYEVAGLDTVAANQLRANDPGSDHSVAWDRLCSSTCQSGSFPPRSVREVRFVTDTIFLILFDLIDSCSFFIFFGK